MTDSFETITKQHLEHTITVEWFYDYACEAPWEHEEGHGPVSDWVTRDKHPGELVLCSDRRSYRYYDYAEAIKIAKRDRWDARPYKTGTKGQQAHRAVMADFDYLKRWCDNDWFWCGYVVKIDGTDYDESLWGIDSDSVKEFTNEAFGHAVAWLEKELGESHRAACADIATV